MTTSAIAVSSDPSATQQVGAAAAKNVLGKDDFLKLLTAQLANQDPLSPVDNQAFIAQLAQFSSLEQMQGVSSRLDSLLLAAASSNQMNTASLVGKDVSFKASGVDLADGTKPSLQVKIAARGAVACVVQDDSGRTVRTLALGTHDAGTFDLGWDGRDDRGNALPAGHYTVKVSARGADGSDLTAEARSSGRVQGVSFDGDAAELIIGTSHVKLADVVQITQS
jgi:flagellar basal-body rod modification protein FlgD